MPRRRILNPEEERLWHEVARTIRRRATPTPAITAESAPTALPAPPPAPPEPVPPFRIGEAARPGTTSRPPAAPLAMDARTFRHMTRGKLAPEARIDLHGMTLAEAHPELIRFILNAASGGLRLVLVITGKGKPADDPFPRPTGILRHQVPVWLRQPPLGPVVQQVAEAHLRHGGAGALYVYLRRIAR
jgi:DNA-nicking Smr family endonuclease